MKYTFGFCLLLLLLISICVKGQDTHFTDNTTVSNFFNPAQTGDFLGHIKVQTALRTQYERTYEHGLVGAQINLTSPIKKTHWLAIGMNILYDQSGSLVLKSTGGILNLAYHIPLGKKGSNTISLGGGISSFNLSADTKNYRSETTILGNVDPDKKALNNLNTSILSFSLGVYVKAKINKKNTFRTGISMIHLNSPEFKVVGIKNNSSLGSRLNIFASHFTDISKMITLGPAIYLSFSEQQKNINLQMLSEWKLNNEDKWRGVLGISHRYGESWDLITGYKTERMYISLSFDLLTSTTADVIRNPGAMELGAFYIFYKNKKPILRPIIHCPRL